MEFYATNSMFFAFFPYVGVAAIAIMAKQKMTWQKWMLFVKAMLRIAQFLQLVIDVPHIQKFLNKSFFALLHSLRNLYQVDLFGWNI